MQSTHRLPLDATATDASPLVNVFAAVSDP